MMKKILVYVLTAVTIICCFTACSNDTPKEVNVTAIYTEIENSVTIPDFIELTSSDIADYIAVDPSDFKQMVVKISAEAISADQIVICEGVDAAAADRIEDAFKTYLNSVKKSFENYLPSEFAKMEDIEVSRRGNYVYYAVSSESSTIEAIFNKYFK